MSIQILFSKKKDFSINIPFAQFSIPSTETAPTAAGLLH